MSIVSNYNFCFLNEYLNEGNSHLYYQHNSVTYMISDSVLKDICYQHLYPNSLYNRLFNGDMLILYIYLIIYVLTSLKFINYCYILESYYTQQAQKPVLSSDESESDSDTSDSNESNNNHKVNQYLHNIFIQQFVSSSKNYIFYYLHPDYGLRKMISYYLFDTDSTVQDDNQTINAEELYNQVQQNLGTEYFCHNPENVRFYPITHTLDEEEQTYHTSFNELHFIHWLHQTKIYHHVIANRDRILSQMKENNHITEDEYQKYINCISFQKFNTD
jgi:hypothetical protein